MVITPQAGVGVINQARETAESSTLEQQKWEHKEVLVKISKAGGSIIRQAKDVAEPSAQKQQSSTLEQQKAETQAISLPPPAGRPAHLTGEGPPETHRQEAASSCAVGSSSSPALQPPLAPATNTAPTAWPPQPGLYNLGSPAKATARSYYTPSSSCDHSYSYGTLQLSSLHSLYGLASSNWPLQPGIPRPTPEPTLQKSILQGRLCAGQTAHQPEPATGSGALRNRKLLCGTGHMLRVKMAAKPHNMWQSCSVGVSKN